MTRSEKKLYIYMVLFLMSLLAVFFAPLIAYGACVNKKSSRQSHTITALAKVGEKIIVFILDDRWIYLGDRKIGFIRISDRLDGKVPRLEIHSYIETRNRCGYRLFDSKFSYGDIRTDVYNCKQKVTIAYR